MPKKLFLFILIYVIALSFFFLKCGHTLFKSRYFKSYEDLQRGHNVTILKNSKFQAKNLSSLKKFCLNVKIWCAYSY